ncbi:MAG: hypothetical protein UR60_C0015G0024 [Candidatus Moranbacteria bacterium GW2011_GWF2_34_56]|nr:MAG: hypothetical protein UR60_C0015G0024 [Candidatus Moranbacteria bacterium GW2011_GWF2_34_56]
MPKRLIGFSTGTFFEFSDPLAKESINFVKNLGCETIEVNWHRIKSQPPSKNLSKIIDRYFQHVSLHLPVDMSDGGGIFKTIDILNRTYEIFIRCKSFGYAVIHPNMIAGWDKFYQMFNHNFSLPLAIENMDDRKKSFRDLHSLLEFFKKYPAIGLVFDVNHWITNGNSIASIANTIETFLSNGVKLVGIHLSGTGFHEPLFKTNTFHRTFPLSSKVFSKTRMSLPLN